jgi:hypothetical protein
MEVTNLSCVADLAIPINLSSLVEEFSNVASKRKYGAVVKLIGLIFHNGKVIVD